jgi:hypothetical protein
MRISIVVLFALAACGQPAAPPTYPPTTEINFMRACEAHSTVPGLCACVWDKIEANVPPADFTALEAMPGAEREAHPLKRQIDGYALSCGAELSREPAPAP